MQITLVSSGNTVTVSDVLDEFVSCFCTNESELNSFTDSQYLKLSASINELKEMTDFLIGKFTVDVSFPKRNSKVSLASWISEVLLGARQIVDTSETIAQSGERSPDKNYWCPQCDEWMDRSGFSEVLGSDFQEQLCKACGSEVRHGFDFDHRGVLQKVDSDLEAIADQVADSSNPEIEVLGSGKKPVYTISIVTDGGFSEERVNRLPPYLIDRKGNLLKKFWHRSCDAGYSEITSKHLSNIAVNSGLVIKLMAENLEVSQACIGGDPPPFIVDRGGVYKRDRLKLGLAVRYGQVVSEYLSNIVVV